MEVKSTQEDTPRCLLALEGPMFQSLLVAITEGLPQIIDPGLSGDGTLGLTLLDITDHWVFNYSLLTVGLLEVLMIGWVFGAGKLRAALNENAKVKLGGWFEILIRYLLPVILLVVIVTSLAQEWPLYGSSYDMPGYSWLTMFIPIFWLAFTLFFAFYITRAKTVDP